MDIRHQLGKATLPILRHAPHKKITLPYPYDPQVRLTFYPDTELGLWLGREQDVVKWWKDTVDGSMVVYDIGAYIGVYSLLAAKRGATVHAFEPDDSTAARIQEQAIKNGIGDLITTNKSVVSDTDNEVTLYRDTSGRRNSLLESRADKEEITVNSKTLRKYASEYQIPDLVKIDVEGAGNLVLDGAGSLIKERGMTWLIEVHNDAEQQSIKKHFSDPRYNSRWIGSKHIMITS